MKTKRLIELLQKNDPSGEIEVFLDGNIDVWYLEHKAMYWDGHGQLLIRDESKRPYFDVIGAKVCAGGDKLVLVGLSIEDAFLDVPDLPVDLSELTPWARARWQAELAKARAEAKKIIREVDEEMAERDYFARVGD